MAQPKQQKRTRNGWSDQEYRLLWEEVERASRENLPLRVAFDEISKKTGRKPNSVRNFYYAAVKLRDDAENMRKHTQFTLFDADEVSSLLREVLIGRSKGESVRACVARLAEGDKTLMLRYQNKYRAMLRMQPDVVREMADQLRREGVRLGDPVAQIRKRAIKEAQDSIANAAVSPQPFNVDDFISGLQTLCNLASQRLSARRGVEEADRLAVRVDLLRAELSRKEEQLAKIARIVERISEEFELSPEFAAIVLQLAEAAKPLEPLA